MHFSRSVVKVDRPVWTTLTPQSAWNRFNQLPQTKNTHIIYLVSVLKRAYKIGAGWIPRGCTVVKFTWSQLLYLYRHISQLHTAALWDFINQNVFCMSHCHLKVEDLCFSSNLCHFCVRLAFFVSGFPLGAPVSSKRHAGQENWKL